MGKTFYTFFFPSLPNTFLNFYPSFSSRTTHLAQGSLSLSHYHSGSLVPLSLPSTKPKVAHTTTKPPRTTTWGGSLSSFFLSTSIFPSPYLCLLRLKPRRPIPPLMATEHNNATTNVGYRSLSLFLLWILCGFGDWVSFWVVRI
ncbi:hypothetical protein ACB092_12G221800 [Castanea dentata]